MGMGLVFMFINYVVCVIVLISIGDRVDPYGSILAKPEELNETSVSVYQVQYGNGFCVHRRL